MPTKFTDVLIKNLKPKETAYTVRESNGFAVRVRPTGVKSWLLIYDNVGKRINLTLGTYPEMALAEARRAVLAARQSLARGIDPAEQKRATRAAVEAERREPTIADLVTEFTTQYRRPKACTMAEYARILRHDVLPAWGSRKVRDITRRDVALLIDSIAQRAGIMANHTLAVIRRLFSFAVERGIIEQSPAAVVRMPSPIVTRDRVLSDEEIQTLWTVLDNDTTPGSEYLKLAIKLLLVTAVRKSELLNATWNEFDLHNAWWTIPGERVKNGRTHRVPLNVTALRLLADLKALGLPGKFLFPSLYGGQYDKPVTGHALLWAIRRYGLGFEFTPHDLRRTVATQISSLGFNRLIVDKVLNHVDRTVGGIYDRHSYDKEKRQALDAWDRRLTWILTGFALDNVRVFPVSK